MSNSNLQMNLPDFICIGAQRSGTTWLYENLGFHPQIWLPPIKEIHYLNSRNKPFKRKVEIYLRHLRARTIASLKDILALDDHLLANWAWDLHYFLGKRNDDWYLGLFRPASAQVAGEITPDYAVMDMDMIKHLRELNPDLKIIYLMRDPIDRSWSSAAKDLARQKRRYLEKVPDDELVKKLTGPGPTARSNHLQVLENWESVFDSGQIFIAFFEEIIEGPAALLKRIYRFLGVSDSDKFIRPDLDRKVNATSRYGSAIPVKYQTLLAAQQIEQLRLLSDRFGGPATTWLRRAEAIIARREVDG